MLFDNPIFNSWYTDSMDIYRVTDKTVGNVDKKERELLCRGIPCRIYSKQSKGPRMKEGAAGEDAVDKVACDLSVDVRAGDELHIIRGGMLGIETEPERYFAGKPHPYYDPVGGVLSGLEHLETALLTDAIIK